MEEQIFDLVAEMQLRHGKFRTGNSLHNRLFPRKPCTLRDKTSFTINTWHRDVDKNVKEESRKFREITERGRHGRSKQETGREEKGI